MTNVPEVEQTAYDDFLAKKNNALGDTKGQFYPFKLENLFADECERIAQGLIYEKFNSDQASSMLIGIYKGYKELKNDLN